MPKITVNKLATSNNMPTITGTVQFERFDSLGKPKHTIQVYVNYNKYKLFDGNLGIDEKASPNIWKLHFSSPLYPGTYDIQAQIVDVNTNTVVASDDTLDELTIAYRPAVSYATPKSNPLTILGKMALVAGLMNGLQKAFGGQNGIGDNPSVHPAQDDQISTHLGGRGAQERNEHPTVKDKEKRQKKMVVPYPVPRPAEFKSTKPAGADAALAKAKEALGDSSGLDATVDPGDAAWNSKIDDTEKVLAEAQGKTDAMNQTFDEAVNGKSTGEGVPAPENNMGLDYLKYPDAGTPGSNQGNVTNAIINLNPGGTGNAATDVGSPFG